jgi:hypothetical protein
MAPDRRAKPASLLLTGPQNKRKEKTDVIEDIKGRIEALQERIETLRGYL